MRMMSLSSDIDCHADRRRTCSNEVDLFVDMIAINKLVWIYIEHHIICQIVMVAPDDNNYLYCVTVKHDGQ